MDIVRQGGEKMINKIVSAGPEHVKDCARLQYVSGPEMYDYMFDGTKEEVMPVIEMYTEMSGTMFSTENAFVDIQGDAVRGFVLGLAAKDMMKKSIPMMFTISKLIRLKGFRGMMRMMSHLSLNKYFPKLNKDEYFISNLAVYKEYRGQGVGKGLLEQAEITATMMGLPKLSLYVEMDNEGAKRLYERYGFVRTDGAKIPEHIGDIGVIGFYKMVKEI